MFQLSGFEVLVELLLLDQLELVLVWEVVQHEGSEGGVVIDLDKVDDGQAGFEDSGHALENFLDFIAQFGGVGDVGHQALFGVFEALGVALIAGSAIISIATSATPATATAD